MEVTRFDDLLRSHVNAPSRRSVVQLLAALAASSLVGLTHGDDSAAKKHKSRKAALCLNGQTVFVAKKTRKRLLSQGATPGACLTPPPPPPPPPPPCPKNCAGKKMRPRWVRRSVRHMHTCSDLPERHVCGGLRPPVQWPWLRS